MAGSASGEHRRSRGPRRAADALGISYRIPKTTDLTTTIDTKHKRRFCGHCFERGARLGPAHRRVLVTTEAEEPFALDAGCACRMAPARERAPPHGQGLNSCG